MTMQPRFITLEGGEGAGKSTQVRLLADKLEAARIAVLCTREPGGSPGAEEIRRLLVEGAPGRWDAVSEMLLMFAARADHVARTIRPALDRGQWVLCDRFTDSTYAYQGAGRGLAAPRIAAIEQAVLDGFKPHLTLVLNLPVEAGLARARARAGTETRFEQFDTAFHTRLRDGFLARVQAEPERCAVIDANGDIETVAARIWAETRRRFGL